MYAEDEARLLIGAAADSAHLDAMVERRVAGFPLEHVVGWAEFCGLRMKVEPGVFVPRRRSEFLVAQAVDVGSRMRNGGRPLVVLDMCCGSGAVGAAIAAARAMNAAKRPPEVHAVDIDPAAVACARQNLAACDGEVYEGDLYEPLPARLRARVDLLVVNAPYVPTGEIATLPAEARLHERPVALDGGGDGLDVQRRIVAGAHRWLAPGGALVIETGRHQVDRSAAIVDEGLPAHVIRVAESPDYDVAIVIAEARGYFSAFQPPWPKVR